MTPRIDRTFESRRALGQPSNAILKALRRWIRLLGSPSRRISHAIVLILTLLFCCCKSRAEGAHTNQERVVLARGDRVLVEPAAAHFFEGTVLSVEGDRLRVQKADTGDTVVVAQSDAYRLPPKQTVDAASFAVCQRGAGKWAACRIEAQHGDKIQALDADGVRFQTTSERVLKPSPVTELNLKSYFERAHARSEFVRASLRAGAPKAANGWKPAPGERVLALMAGEWYSAHVREIDEGGVYVRWADGRITKVSANEVAPEPPYAAEFRRGDFVLVRPASAGQAWTREQVRAATPEELRIVNVEGDVRAILPRDAARLGN